MAKGGGAQTTPAAPAVAPQTDALKHLMDMVAPKMRGVEAEGDMPGDQGSAMSSSMPVMDPQAWMKQGTGNFMPSGGPTGSGKGGGSGGQIIGGGTSGKGGASG